MSMKNKKYSGLSVEQLAAKTFDKAMEQNPAEMARISQGVTNSEMEHYQSTVSLLFGMASTWSMEYWKSRAFHFSSWGSAAYAMFKGNDAKKGLSDMVKAEIRLLSLDAALDNVCRRRGVNAGLIRRFADAEKFEATVDGVKSDKELVAGFELTLDLVADKSPTTH